MITGTVWTDTSYFQDALAFDYERFWVGFRGCDGSFCDPKFHENLAMAKRLYDAKRIAGATIYLVYRPGEVATSIGIVQTVVRQVLTTLPRWVTFEIDAESWGGAIRGDRSGDLNQMAALLAVYAGHDLRRVIGYGNRSDLDAMWRTKAKGLVINVASYGSQIASYPNMVSQQYGDGTTNRWGCPPGLPLSSKNFGHCDHNIFLGRSPAQVAALLGVLDAPAAPPIGDEFTMTAGLSPQSKKDVDALIEARLQRWLPRLAETLRSGITNLAFPAKSEPGFPFAYASVIDRVGIDGKIAAAAGGGYFYAAADPKTGKPAGAVYMLVGDKKYHVRTGAEHRAMNLSQVVHALDPTHPLLKIPNL